MLYFLKIGYLFKPVWLKVWCCSWKFVLKADEVRVDLETDDLLLELDIDTTYASSNCPSNCHESFVMLPGSRLTRSGVKRRKATWSLKGSVSGTPGNSWQHLRFRAKRQLGGLHFVAPWLQTERQLNNVSRIDQPQMGPQMGPQMRIRSRQQDGSNAYSKCTFFADLSNSFDHLRPCMTLWPEVSRCSQLRRMTWVLETAVSPDCPKLSSASCAEFAQRLQQSLSRWTLIDYSLQVLFQQR